MSAWWQEALRYPAQHRPALAWIVVLSLVSIGLNLLLPWPIKLIVDGVLAGNLLPETWLVGTSAAEQLGLVTLDPAYRTWFEGHPEVAEVRSGREHAVGLFEELQPGSGQPLRR